MLVITGPNGYDAKVAAVELARRAPPSDAVPFAAASVRLKKRAKAAPDESLPRAITLRHISLPVQAEQGGTTDWRSTCAGGDDQGARVILFDEGEDQRAFDAAVGERPRPSSMNKTIADSDRWFRSSAAEIEAYRDGPTLDAAGLSFFALHMRGSAPVSPETSHSAWLETLATSSWPAPLTGLIAVSDRYDRRATASPPDAFGGRPARAPPRAGSPCSRSTSRSTR